MIWIEFVCIGDDGVRISRITLNNYRSFNNATIDLNGDSVVIFGENGVGKSSVLHAINLLFIRILYSIVQEKTKPTIYIQTGDIKNGGDECNIEVDFDISGKSYSFARNIKRDGHGEYKRKNLESIVREFRSDFLESDSSNMPIFVNYGIHRLVLDIPLRIRQRHHLLVDHTTQTINSFAHTCRGETQVVAHRVIQTEHNNFRICWHTCKSLCLTKNKFKSIEEESHI